MIHPDELFDLVQHLPDIVWTLDVAGERPRYTFVSGAVERVLGEPAQVFRDDFEAFFRRVHRRDLDRFGLEPPGPGSDQAGRTRVRYFKPDGSMVWLDIHFAWVYAADGSLTILHGITRDVTEYAEVEAQLRRSELGMRNAQAMSNVGTFEWDPVRSWSIWSPEHYRIFGYEPPGEVADAQALFQEAVLAEDFMKVARAWQRSLEHAEPFSVEYRIRRPDGEVRWIDSRGGARFDADGALLGVDGTVRDVTVEKRADEALRRFVADAAHELRTPVAAILGAVELLVKRRETLDEAQLGVLLDVLTRQSQRLRDIQSSLIDLLAFEHDVDRVDVSALDAGALVDRTVGEVVRPEGTTVTTAIEPAWAMAEPARLGRVVIELLRNAFDHGGPNVEVTVGRAGDKVEITVGDDGPGVADDQVAHLSQPFSRAGKFGGSGAGIGLAVVDRLVEVLGGSVSYEPQGHLRSRFVVQLPVARPRDAGAGSEPAAT
jgi:PAS domain S-box-containing protein